MPPAECELFAASVDGVSIALRVSPRAARDRAGGVARDADGRARLRVAVTAPPADGAANAAIVKLLSRAWGVPKSSLSIASGATGRNKSLFIAGDPEAILARLRQWFHDDGGPAA